MSGFHSEALTIGDMLLRSVQRGPGRDAVVFPEERLSYAELADRTERIACGLMGLGARAGDHVGLLMANSPDCVATFFATCLVGAVAVPINTRYRAVELPYVISDAELAMIVTSDRIDDYVDLPALLTEALPGLTDDAQEPEHLRLSMAPKLRTVIALGARVVPGMIAEGRLLEVCGDVDRSELEARRARTKLRDPAIILYTSGTTSRPSGCVITHEALVRCWQEVGAILAVGPEDRCWSPCPLFHLASIGPLLFCIGSGAAFVSDTWLRAEEAVALCERERVTVLYPAYPPLAQALLTAESYPDADLSSARAMLNVGPPDTLARFQRAMPQAVQVSLYGLTEGGGAITYSRLEDDLEARVQTCGHPVPGAEVRIVSPDARELAEVGTSGEIVIRGVSLFERYWNNDAKTAETLDPDGWFYTGDLGVLDEHGRLRFLGRLKEMLKVGGENVAPSEIESHLSTHPAVKLVQVVGIPDEQLDEVPAAFVELRRGTDVAEQEIIDFCSGQLASFKVPRYVQFVTQWPMSATKIQKTQLRQALIAALGRTDEPPAGQNVRPLPERPPITSENAR
jgi:fatty-acyl-CoA synthase